MKSEDAGFNSWIPDQERDLERFLSRSIDERDKNIAELLLTLEPFVNRQLEDAGLIKRPTQKSDF